MSPRFQETWCSQCGAGFGPGDHGYSHCSSHTKQRFTPDGQKIVTSYDFPPIPIRDFDWAAFTDNYDGAPDAGWQPVGHGRTEEAAIADLLNEIEEHEERGPALLEALRASVEREKA